MSSPFRVLLAAETPLDANNEFDPRPFEQHYPMFASYKIDGIRAHRRDELVSRSMKAIRSAYAQREFNRDEYEGNDGELCVRKPPYPGIFSETSSAVMTHGDETPLTWHVFDNTRIDLPYVRRLEILQKKAQINGGYLGSEVRLVDQVMVHRLEDVLDYERDALEMGYEGIILRRPDAPYKQNRSTLKQGYLLKLARWLTAEATIEGFEEMMHNDNVATTDARGYTKRSSHQAGMRPAGMLGNFIVTHPDFAAPFSLSGELDHTFRKYVWEHQDEFKGKLAKFKYRPYGTKDAPRQPIFVGMRSEEDL